MFKIIMSKRDGTYYLLDDYYWPTESPQITTVHRNCNLVINKREYMRDDFPNSDIIIIVPDRSDVKVRAARAVRQGQVRITAPKNYILQRKVTTKQRDSTDEEQITPVYILAPKPYSRKWIKVSTKMIDVDENGKVVAMYE